SSSMALADSFALLCWTSTSSTSSMACAVVDIGAAKSAKTDADKIRRLPIANPSHGMVVPPETPAVDTGPLQMGVSTLTHTTLSIFYIWKIPITINALWIALEAERSRDSAVHDLWPMPGTGPYWPPIRPGGPGPATRAESR